MNSEELGKRFREVVKGVNFVTSKIVDYIQQGNFVCELSYDFNYSGALFKHHIYGVTVVDMDKKERRTDLGKVFDDDKQSVAYNTALEYIKTL